MCLFIFEQGSDVGHIDFGAAVQRAEDATSVPIVPRTFSQFIRILGNIDLQKEREVVFSEIAQSARRFVAAHCLLFLINERDGETLSAYALEDSPECAVRTQIDLVQSACTLTRLGTTPLWTSVESDSRLEQLRGLLVAENLKNLYLVPLTIGSEAIGTLGFGCSTDQTSELLTLQDAARVIALTIDRMLRIGSSQVHASEMSRHSGRVRLDAEIRTLVATSRDLQQIAAGCSKSLQGVIGADYIEIALLDASRRQLVISGFDSPGTLPAVHIGSAYSIENSPAGHAFSLAKSAFFHHSTLHAFSLTGGWNDERIRTIYSVPLCVPGGPVGTLTVGWCDEIAFSSEIEELLRRVGSHLAPVAENHLLSERLTSPPAALAQNAQVEDVSIDLRTRLGIIGDSGVVQETLSMLPPIAQSRASVLIQGDTGTGKELVARAIHDLSSRRDGPFIKVNCAAIPSSLFESELFGHERGAFTGAITRKPGRVELANGGTLFLDEVGDLPLELQAKLLTFIEDRRFERLGGTKSIETNCRFVAATNQNLQKMVRSGKFRADLYYRLSGIPVYLPPLHERRTDIPLLVTHFVRRHSQVLGKIIDTIPPDVMTFLVQNNWPGNIRELERFVEWAVVISPGSVLTLPQMPGQPSARQMDPLSRRSLQILEDHEKNQIRQALEECKGIVGGPLGAAAKLGLKRTTLQYKVRKFGLTTVD
jgi:formate hydrogenlyase transcriptional activator